MFKYNGRGEVEYTATDLGGTTNLDSAGLDRVIQTQTDYYTNGIANVRRVRTFAWGTNNVNASNLVAAIETSVDGLQTWSLAFGLTNRSQTVYASGGNRYQTSTAPDGAKVVSAFQSGRFPSVNRFESVDPQSVPQRFKAFMDNREHGPAVGTTFTPKAGWKPALRARSTDLKSALRTRQAQT